MKVSIIGIGHVGSSLGIALVAQGLADEIVLVGRRKDAAMGEAMDLLHASAFTRPVNIRAGGISDTAGSNVIAICVAGNSTHPTRDGAIVANSAIFHEIIPPLSEASPGGIFLVTTNPLDAMTTLTLRLSRRPP